ncbi:MAG: thiamine phosphate synthase [Prevotella sp.]|nr:thiamine phosphate synthase [Prevotella sp.]
MMLQFISHYTEQYSYIDSVRMAIEGGCRWIQLRMKDSTTRQLFDTALELLPLCHTVGAKLIIDDRLDVALAVKADGVHLGQNDLPVAKAREIAGNAFIIGGTANTFEQIKAHAEAGADYVGVGPFRFTTTKQGLAPVLGLDGYKNIVPQMKAENILIPIIAIGGIALDDIPALMNTGISGIALSGSILHADNPIENMKMTIKTLIKYG